MFSDKSKIEDGELKIAIIYLPSSILEEI